jgi:8-oxo-dGTP pyrophosphatase MutT (NUDIX family)
MAIGRFYGGVGALIRRDVDDRYLLLKRSGDKDYASGVWECVTGRVDEGEGFEEAVYREVNEEIGAAVRIEFFIGTTHFYRGEDKPENELIGVVFACSLTDLVEVHLSPEHTESRWVTADEVVDLVVGADPSSAWIKRVIARAEVLRELYPAELIAFHQRYGFGLDGEIPVSNRD